jgi:phage-related minor tail protein
MAEIVISVDSSQVRLAKSDLDNLGLSVVKQVRVVERLERHYRLLDKAFNTGKISAQQYSKGIEQVDKAIEMVQSGQISLIATQQKLATATNQATAAMSRQAQVAQESQKSHRRFELGLQQAGFQVGDFFVQVASGTSPMVAFTQQATQLVSFFGGPWGAVIGAALSIFGAVAIAMGAASRSTTELNFDFQKFGQDMRVAIEPLMPIIRALGTVFTFLKDVITDSVNAILNSLRILGAAVGAVPAAFGSLVDLVDAQMFRLELVVLSYVNSIKAAIQGMFDTLSGSTAMINNSQGKLVPLADTYRKDSAYYSGVAALEAQNIANMPGPGDVIGQAISGVQPIDIRTYFSRTPVSSGGGGASESALANLIKEQEHRKELLKLSGQEKLLKEEIFRITDQLGEEALKLSTAQITELARVNLALQEQEDLQQKLLDSYQQLSDTMSSSMETAFMSIIDGTESAKDAFKKMAYEMIKELYRVLVVQRMVGSFNAQAGTGTGLVGLIGKALSGTRASGGSIMSGQAYLVGEKGPEVVIPRHSGTVVNADQTAKMSSGAGTTVVNNNISVTGSDAAMVRAEVAKMIPQITNATKAAVIDARLRGGQMKAAFS